MRRAPYQGMNLNPIWAIIGLNFMVFIFTLVNQRAAFNLLGLTPALANQQPWTLITSLFVHAGFWHILTNMFTFYFFGSNLLGMVGDRKFLLVYFGGGILGSIMFWWLAPDFSTVVGASGAVFGVGGALAVLVPRSRVFIFPFPVPIPLWAAVIFGFLIISFNPGVAWEAHLGGLVFGLVAGYYFRRGQRRRIRW
ncbi:MAG: rhomboid family intramembrane serine protease [Chloroflexota bacterium]